MSAFQTIDGSRTSGPGPVIRRGVAIATLGVLVASCSAQPANDGQTTPAGTSCPDAVTRLIDTTKTPGAETNLAIDKTKSFVDSPDAQARLEAQVRAATAKAVEEGQALRVSVFTGSVATVRVAFACPVLAAEYNNPAAREKRTAHLQQVAGDAVWAAVRDTAPGPGGRGSSIVGGWAFLAASAPLAEQRHAVMLSDGRGKQEKVAVDLSGYTSVSMFSVGRVASSAADTQSTAALVDRWQQWLTKHGAAGAALTVTSGELQ
ncbi:MAG: hypothetical protein QM650_09385 [Microlunatus sp.]